MAFLPTNRDPLEELFVSLARLVEARKKKGPLDDDPVKEALRARAEERFQRCDSAYATPGKSLTDRGGGD